MKNILLTALLLTATCSAHADGIQYADYQHMKAVMKCYSFAHDAGGQITDAAPLMDESVRLFKMYFPKMMNREDYNPSPELLAQDFAEEYQGAVEDAVYEMEDYLKAKGVRYWGSNITDAAVTLYQQQNCSYMVKQ